MWNHHYAAKMLALHLLLGLSTPSLWILFTKYDTYGFIHKNNKVGYHTV